MVKNDRTGNLSAHMIALSSKCTYEHTRTSICRAGFNTGVGRKDNWKSGHFRPSQVILIHSKGTKTSKSLWQVRHIVTFLLSQNLTGMTAKGFKTEMLKHKQATF